MESCNAIMQGVGALEIGCLIVAISVWPPGVNNIQDTPY